MKKLVYIFILLNICALVLNNFFVLVEMFDYQWFDFGSQATVMLSIFGSGYVYLKPTSISWFGSSVDSSHYSNMVVGYIIAMVCILPATFFNLYPLSRLILD